jgi:ABC-type amino acid transport substrate-binding protein
MKKNLLVFILFIFVSSITQGKTLKIGVSLFDPPFVTQLHQNHFSGFDVSMMEYVCKSIGEPCQFVPIQRNKLIHAVVNREVDVAVSGLMINEHNKSLVVYSIPYLISESHLIGLKKNLHTSLQEGWMLHKKIGISNPTYIQQINSMNLMHSKFTYYAKDDELIDAINDGHIEFGLVDAYTAHYWSNNTSDIIHDYGAPISLETSVAIAINKSDEALHNQINHALMLYRHSQEFQHHFHKYLFNTL